MLLPGLLLRPELKGFQSGCVRYINSSNIIGNVSISSLGDHVVSTVYGTHSFGHFGDSIRFGNKMNGPLWITEPMYDRETGRVYRLDNFSSGSNSIQETNFSCYCGSESLQRFGSTMLLHDIDGDGEEDLLVSTISGKEEESGSIHIFLDANSL